MAPPASRPSAPNPGKAAGLGQKIGPLTVGQWLIVAAGAAVLFYMWKKRNDTQAAADETGTASPADAAVGSGGGGLGGSGDIGGTPDNGLSGPAPGPGLTYPQPYPTYYPGGSSGQDGGVTTGAVPEAIYTAQPIELTSPFFNPPSANAPANPLVSIPEGAPGGGGNILGNYSALNPTGAADRLAVLSGGTYTPSQSDYASEQRDYVRTLAYTGADPSKFFTVENTQLGSGNPVPVGKRIPGERYDLAGRVIL